MIQECNQANWAISLDVKSFDFQTLTIRLIQHLTIIRQKQSTIAKPAVGRLHLTRIQATAQATFFQQPPKRQAGATILPRPLQLIVPTYTRSERNDSTDAPIPAAHVNGNLLFVRHREIRLTAEPPVEVGVKPNPISKHVGRL